MANEDITVRFGRAVRQLREQEGFSQEGFADECGLDRSYVGGVERGERNVSIRNIERLAEGLGMTLSQLFGHVE